MYCANWPISNGEINFLWHVNSITFTVKLLQAFAKIFTILGICINWNTFVLKYKFLYQISISWNVRIMTSIVTSLFVILASPFCIDTSIINSSKSYAIKPWMTVVKLLYRILWIFNINCMCHRNWMWIFFRLFRKIILLPWHCWNPSKLDSIIY